MACKHFDLDDNTQNVVELLPEEVRPAELIKERENADLSIKLKKLPKYEKREIPVIDARQFYTNKNGRVKSIRYESH